MSNTLDRVLSELNIHPVLVDVGTSREPPDMWSQIARSSIYVRFDPDVREQREAAGSCFHRALVVNKTVTSEPQGDEVLFYFTQSPGDASILSPDMAALSNFIFADRFTVTGTSTVQAVSLNDVVDSFDLVGIDWLNVDSQRAGWRIFNSLRPGIHSHVLAIDIDLGLISTYTREDLFVDGHKDFVQNGFWLSNLHTYGSIRIKKATVSNLLSCHKWISYRTLEQCMRNTPIWCKARYLRSIEWLSQIDAARRDYVVLWVFAFVDHQFGFSLDIVVEYERRFGEDKIVQMMRRASVDQIKRRMPLAIILKLLPVGIKRVLPAGIRRLFWQV